MKKKLVWMITAVLLLFTACAPTVTEANKMGAVTYPGVDWLAAPESMMKALGKNADSFGIAENDFMPADTRETYYTVNTSLLGENVSVKFTFSPDWAGEEILLRAVDVSFEKADKDTYEKVKAALESEISRQSVAVEYEELLRQIFRNADGSESREIVPADTDPFSNDAVGYTLTFSAESTFSTGDLPDEIQEKVTAFAKEQGVMPEENNNQTYGEILNLPLSVTTLMYEEAKDGETAMWLRFNAIGYCTMMHANAA